MSNHDHVVPPELKTLALDALIRHFFELSWSKARSWIEPGKVTVNDKMVTDSRYFPGEGAKIHLNMNAPRNAASAKPGSVADFKLTSDRVIFCDTQIIVVNKPSGISTVPFEPREKNTLQAAASRYLKGPPLEIVHRIDKETSGLLVFARTQTAAQHLAKQFRFHTVHRRYLAIAHGDVKSQTFRTVLVENRGDGLRGSLKAGQRLAAGQGQEAITHTKAIRSLNENATLIECSLETGRTHQIRIHLSEAGHPLLGEKLYTRGFSETLYPAPRVMLHAVELGLIHPMSGAKMQWRQEPPEDFEKILLSLQSEQT